MKMPYLIQLDGAVHVAFIVYLLRASANTICRLIMYFVNIGCIVYNSHAGIITNITVHSLAQVDLQL